MKDLFGKAILEYQQGNYTEDLVTATSISEEDILPLPYLFRTFEEMPPLEQTALQMAKGRVLDVGCGAGSHSLYLQNERNLKVTAIDISPGAIKTCQLRGIDNAIQTDVLKFSGTFDTILLLMNGAGMCGRLHNISPFLQHLKSLLSDDGMILVDSSDIIYMFDEDEDGGKWIPDTGSYYGELEYHVSYKGEKEASFPWLYIDYNTLQNAAHASGLQCELIIEGEHYDYLAKIYK